MRKRKKILTAAAVLFTALLAGFLLLCFVTLGMYPPAFLGRVLTHWDSDITDYKVFPYRTIAAGDAPYQYEFYDSGVYDDFEIEYTKNGKNRRAKLQSFVEDTDTTSFIIVQDDKIVYEQYANGYTKESVNTSFSMSKSVVSLLIGKAVEEGYIESIHQPISDYIGEFSGLEIGNVTIEDLLLMRSAIEYNEDKFLWFGDDSLTYWSPDLRRLALEHTKLTDREPGRFHYNNYHPLLLGIILERSTGVKVSDYFQEKIWGPVGAEYSASWSLDSEKSGFEKMESGINFCAVDFIKIGSMVLHNGSWNGNRIIGEDWLEQSVLSTFPLNPDEYAGTFLEHRNIGYKYMWYSCPSEQSGFDIFAWGKSDQILYISPANHTVILRTGKSDGGVSDWIKILQFIVSPREEKENPDKLQ